MKQKYIHKDTKEIVEAEQVLAPVKQGMSDEDKTQLEQTYSELHGALHIPHGYWKIWKDGRPRETSPNDFLFKKFYQPHQEKAEGKPAEAKA